MKTIYPDVKDDMPSVSAHALTFGLSAVLNFAVHYQCAAAESDDSAERILKESQSRVTKLVRDLSREYLRENTDTVAWNSARDQCVRYLRLTLDMLGETL